MQSTDYLQNANLLQMTMKEIKDRFLVKFRTQRGVNNKDKSMMLHQSLFELGGDYKQLPSESMVVKENLNKIQF